MYILWICYWGGNCILYTKPIVDSGPGSPSEFFGAAEQDEANMGLEFCCTLLL